MGAETKTNRFSLVSPDLNTIKQFLDEPGDASGIVQCNLGILSSTASDCSPLRMGVDSQECCGASHAFGSTLL